MPHSADATGLVNAVCRSDSLADSEMRVNHDMAAEIAAIATVVDPGRGNGCMAACGPGQRLPTYIT